MLADALLRRARLARNKPAARYSVAWLAERGLFSIGDRSYDAPTVHYYAGDTAKITIGDWTSIALDVEIMPGGNHRIDAVASFPVRHVLDIAGYEADGPWSKGEVTIGSDVWIGRGSRILGGVDIGHGAIVAAWSTVYQGRQKCQPTRSCPQSPANSLVGRPLWP